MTTYDRVAGHPLAGVPQDVLTVARDVLAGCPGIDPNQSSDAADAVVQGLHEDGYLTWSRRAPTREDLLLALVAARDEWEFARRFVDDVGGDGAPSLLEHLTDAVVEPLVRRLVGGDGRG